MAIPVAALALGGSFAAAGFGALFMWWLLKRPLRSAVPWWIAAICAELVAVSVLQLMDAFGPYGFKVGQLTTVAVMLLAAIQMHYRRGSGPRSSPREWFRRRQPDSPSALSQPDQPFDPVPDKDVDNVQLHS